MHSDERAATADEGAAAGGGGRTGRRLRVLESFRRPRPTTNPYLPMLAESLRPYADVSYFSWGRAVLGRYDVLHVHWPEHLLGATTAARRTGRRALFALVLLRLRLGGPVLVRTAHNTRPHEGVGRIDGALLRAADAVTTLWVRLNERTPGPTAAPVRTVPHGHYVDWYEAHPVPAPVPGRLLFFGLVRPYKGIEGLLSAFRALDDDAASLRIVGGVPAQDRPEQTLRALEAAQAQDPRVTSRLEYVDEAQLATEVGRAQLVVLPYDDMHNSGAALLALSLGRPVLVPVGAVTEDLAAEVGAQWVLLYTSPLGPEALRDALERSASTGATGPDLRGRDWSVVGQLHAAAFADAVDERRRQRSARSRGTGR